MSPITAEDGTFLDAPSEHGLIVSLDDEGTCWMRLVPDRSLDYIHPNIRIPSTLQNPVELGGGGSGVTILRGTDEAFGDIVLKHGGHKDSSELFALATIEEQLRQRAQQLDAEDASSFMVSQTPDYRFVYISPDHLRSRGSQLWDLAKDSVLSPQVKCQSNSPKDAWSFLTKTVMAPCFFPKGTHHSGTIRICYPGFDAATGPTVRKPVEFVKDHLNIHLPTNAAFDEKGWVKVAAAPEGYKFLHTFFKHLTAIQKAKGWKFTLAQKTIGGDSPVTGSSLLAQGKLNGDALRRLTSGLKKVMGYLQRLTSGTERTGIDEVRQALAEAQESETFGPATVPDSVDTYVGLSVKKNFHPISGRFRKLREFGKAFRSGKLVLDEAEQTPSKLLGALLQPNGRMEDAFAAGPSGPTALEMHCSSWQEVLRLATSLEGEAALARVWTCGLTDAGLHNLFLGAEHLELFDMGEPTLMAMPAFLTKFLMSFFHTLGMEEGPDGKWLVRFNVVQGEGGEERLALSEDTESVMPQVDQAFQTVLDCLVQEVFNGEEAVRKLLMTYVVLQLLSDAAFCLERWSQKGGGAERLRPQARNLEKWLWRALWDLYIATVVADKDWRTHP